MKFFIYLLLFVPIFAQDVTLEFLRDKPQGIARDFYIWQFLNQDISANEANEAYALIHRPNQKLLSRYLQKGNDPSLLRRATCEKMKLKELLMQDEECIAHALKLSDASAIPKNRLKTLSAQLAPHAPLLAQQLAILSAKNPWQTLLDTNDANLFATLFEGVGQEYRLAHFNKRIPAKTLEKIANQNNPKMGKVLRNIILNPAYKPLQESLAKTDKITNIDDHALFYLGLNALTHGEKKHAISYFVNAKKHASIPLFIARAAFWHYLASGDVKLLGEVAQMRNPNIYSLYAAQVLGIAPSFEIVREILDKDTPKRASWDITDPFAWLYIEPQSKENLSIIKSHDTQAHLALVMQREARFQKYFYIRPYRESFARFSEEKQALLYAIARQESHFIPTAISTSYALGMMQIMPFNVEAIAKSLKEERALTDMFNPAINIRYAEIFLRDLLREFSHPLFIFYAYNGGSGFTRRMLASGNLFKKSRALDPWYSIEMIPYEESRYYGSKVLTNYIIYQQSFGKDINIVELLRKTLL